MKVTVVPVQMILSTSSETIEIPGVTVGLTVIEIPEELTVDGTAHEALDVRLQLTTSPLFKEEVVKLVELVPAFTPFTCH